VPDSEDRYERKIFAAHDVGIAAVIERGIATFLAPPVTLVTTGSTLSRSKLWRMATLGSNIRASLMGERRAPREGVGSTSGFEEFLKVMAKPRHPRRGTVNSQFAMV
jgi:hypothetical protein